MTLRRFSLPQLASAVVGLVLVSGAGAWRQADDDGGAATLRVVARHADAQQARSRARWAQLCAAIVSQLASMMSSR